MKAIARIPSSHNHPSFRRVASLKNAINALIAGQSKPIRRAQRNLRFDPADFPPPTDKYGTIQSVAATT